ncbi:hypothetical protein ETAA8_32120 [Anatilimnocola aggregata]|uniref:DUF1254 domain-containing protein n=1 Tax=Anatilimnocola aggregata TaxID=2528021 RepID=A0A517YD56_9BACT|nr:DUF1254 domain-containing protein [Anatilimnocola aggregata]QDU28119.1 hypothetical protein ETAA8_32120 [Anatilimnocola aggregata]
MSPLSMTNLLLSLVVGVSIFSAAAQAQVSADEARQIAVDAYIYGYSLITTEVTRVQMTNVDKVEGGLRGPMNQFINVKRYPPGDYRGVSAPNADTLYSVAWLDVGAEPMVFSHADMGDRYFLFPMYSLWMPVIESPGKRDGTGKATNYLVTGPGWSGDVPAGMQQVKSPTRYMLILGRTYADGTEADYKAVNALQAQYKIVPLSAYGKPFTYKAPPVDPNPGFSMTDKPQAVIDAMDTAAYFNMLARLMGSSAPPAAEDAPIVAKMAKIGLVPGKAFDISKLDSAAQAALKDVPKVASEKIFAQKALSGYKQNGWLIPSAAGAYGTDYLQRALIAAFGWPANLPEDAVYPYTTVDSEANTLSGANKYALTFAKGQTPPVNGFWSITMYFDDGGWWFVPNDLNKFTVSMRDNPKFNADGSLTLYFQHESPGKEKEANWLPAPKGDFILMMRMYWPKTGSPSILPSGKGTWRPPVVTQVK